MPFGGCRAKSRLDPLDKFRGERDFRQKHQCLSADTQSFGDSFKIDFGLAGACHAFEKRRVIVGGTNLSLERINSRRLLVIEVVAAEIGIEPRIRLITRCFAFLNSA
jgi:hypothetical protein